MSQSTADHVIDGLRMEPPEPFVQTMEALDLIKPGQTVLLRVGREPLPLYRALELNGFSWQTERRPDGVVEVLIWHRKNKETNEANEEDEANNERAEPGD